MRRSVTSKPVIERGFPLPPNPPKRGRRTKYRWLEMEVGDSFLMPLTGCGDNYANARSCIRNIEQRYGMRFDKALETGGIRIWRTA